MFKVFVSKFASSFLIAFTIGACGASQNTKYEESQLEPQESEKGKEQSPQQSKVSDVNDVKKGLLRENVTEVMSVNIKSFTECFDAELERKPGSQGRIVFRFEIVADGTVSGVEVASNELSDTMAECVTSKLLSLRFPEPAGGSQLITYPFTLTSKKK